jgi:hypothetical protein
MSEAPNAPDCAHAARLGAVDAAFTKVSRQLDDRTKQLKSLGFSLLGAV